MVSNRTTITYEKVFDPIPEKYVVQKIVKDSAQKIHIWRTPSSWTSKTKPPNNLFQ